MQEVAEETLGRKPPLHRNQWFNEECRVMIERENVARLRTLSSNTKTRKAEYDNERKRARKLFRHKKGELLRNKMTVIEAKRITQNPRKYYRKIKDVRSNYNTQCKFIRTKDDNLLTGREDIMRWWEEYYAEMFAGSDGEKTPQEDLNITDQNPLDHRLTPDIIEIENAILVLKNNKAPGIDFITGKMLKHAGDSTARILHHHTTKSSQIFGRIKKKYQMTGQQGL